MSDTSTNVAETGTSTLTRSQKKTFGPKEYTEGGRRYRITARVRHDDECGNGHNTFSITADIDRWNGHWWEDDSGGCLHDEVAKHFPELAPFIKWHLTSTDEPMYYLANTIFHAGDRDHCGLRKGEKRQLRNGKTGLLVWQRVMRNSAGEIVGGGSSSWVHSAEKPAELLTATWEPVWIEGEGKARELDHARSCAVWPDATDEELTVPGLKERLMTRLPKLMQEFRAAVESLGFVY